MSEKTPLALKHLGDEDFVGRLKSLGGRLADYFGDNPDAAQLLLREFVNGGPFTAGPGRQQVQLALGVAVSFVQAGVDAGVFRTTDARRVVLAATGHLLFYYGARQVTDDALGGEGLSAENRALQRAVLIGDFCRLLDVSTD